MRHSLLCVGLPVLALAPVALAQTSVERFERQLQQINRDTRMQANPAVPAGQRAYLDYGGYLSLGFFAIDDPADHTHILRQYDLTGYARLNIDNVHEFFLRARTGYRDWESGDSFDGEGDETTWPTVEQAYYRFDLARYLGAYRNTSTNNNIVFQGGRQFVYWANGLVLAETIDGALIDLTFGPTTLQLLGGVTSHDVVDFDPSRPQFDDHTERGFYGGILSAQMGKHRPFIYGLIQRDYNPDDILTDASSTPPTVTRFDYNSYYLGAGANGSIGDRLLYAAEFAWEGGRGLSSSTASSGAPAQQTREDISAYALDLRLDYLVADPRRTRLSAETIIASGDDDRGFTSTTVRGNRRGTDDNAFNGFGLVNTGLAFAPAVSNLVALRLGASTFPFANYAPLRRMQVGADALFLAKYDMDSPIDEPTSHDRFLGFEPDLYLNWQLTSDVTLAMRYGVFFPGSAIVNNDHPRNFFFMGVTFAF